MIIGIVASTPFFSNPPGPPPTPTPGPPGTVTPGATLPNLGLVDRMVINYDPITGVWMIANGFGAQQFYLSFDRAQTWQLRTLTDPVTASPAGYIGIYIYNGVITTYGGDSSASLWSYNSSDYGVSWSRTYQGSGTRFNKFSSGFSTVDPVLLSGIPQAVFVASDANTSSNRVAFTKDSLTWSLTDNVAAMHSYITQFATSIDRTYGLAMFNNYNPATPGIMRMTNAATASFSYSTTSIPQMFGLVNYSGNSWIGRNGTSMYRSTDSGSTWTLYTATGLDGGTLGNFAYGNGYLAGVWTQTSTSNCFMAYSADGTAWTINNVQLPFTPTGVKFGGDRWLIASNATGQLATATF